jgi:glycosyltransferase involved in cell wall biosynthesis
VNIPLVSVCVPTYNGSDFLAECLSSVLGQTEQRFEVLVVDDASSDQTVSVANEFARRDSRVAVHSFSVRAGLVGNWNRSLQLAKGEWIKFVFQDDLLHPHCLTEQLRCARASSYPFVMSRRAFIFEEATSYDRRAFYANHLDIPAVFGPSIRSISATSVAHAAIQHFGINFFGEPTSALVHRRVFADVGGFSEALAMICDLEFWVRVGSRFGCAYVDEELSQFRVHSRSTSNEFLSRRQFRVSIDGLILRHLYAYAEEYGPLRQAIAGQSSTKSLRDNFWSDLRRLQLQLIAGKEGPEHESLQREWRNGIESYGRISSWQVYAARILSYVNASIGAHRG